MIMKSEEQSNGVKKTMIMKSYSRSPFPFWCLVLLVDGSSGMSQHCDESKCRDQHVLGYSCWAPVGVNNATPTLYPCADDYEGQAVSISKLSLHGGKLQYFTCCTPGYSGPLVRDCTDEVCTSPGNGSTDCWADGPHEPMTCGGDIYKHPRKTGSFTRLWSWDYSQYICCIMSDGTPPLSGKLVIAERILLGLACVAFCFCTVFVLSLISSKEARSQPFNVYLIFLSIPDLILNLILILVASFTLSRAHFPCAVKNAFLYFYGLANELLNIIICHQVYVLLRKSNQRKRFYPPPLSLAMGQVAGKTCSSRVYLCASLYAILGAYASCGKILSYDDSGRNQKVVNAIACAIWAVFPLYSLYVMYRVWSRKLLPISGRTRAMSLFFVRLLVIFFFFFTPMVIFISLEWNSTFETIHFNFLGLYMLSLQGIVIAAFGLTKPDVYRAFRDFLRCRANADHQSSTTMGDTSRPGLFRRSSTSDSMNSIFQNQAHSSSFRSIFETLCEEEKPPVGLRGQLWNLINLYPDNSERIEETDMSDSTRRLSHIPGQIVLASENQKEFNEDNIEDSSNQRNKAVRRRSSDWGMEDEWREIIQCLSDNDDISTANSALSGKEDIASDGLSSTSSLEGSSQTSDEQENVENPETKGAKAVRTSEPNESTAEDTQKVSHSPKVRFASSPPADIDGKPI